MLAFSSSGANGHNGHTHKLDTVDELKLLTYLIQRSEVMVPQDKELYLVQLSDSILQLETHLSKEEDILAKVTATCQKLRDLLEPHCHEMLNPANWVGVVPPPLLIDAVLGAVPVDKITSQPAFHVRGGNYLSDYKKVPAPAALFLLRGVQVVQYGEFRHHIAGQHWTWLPKHDHDNEWLVLNYMVPGSTCVSVVCYFTATPAALAAVRAPCAGTPATAQHPGLELLRRFWLADQDFCDARFKLVPNVHEATYVLKIAIGQKPAMIGQKLTQRYFRGPGYFEVDIDISSSAVATSILGMVRGASKHMVVDVGIVLQAETEEELPELLLCQGRYDHVDITNGEHVVITLDK